MIIGIKTDINAEIKLSFHNFLLMYTNLKSAY